MGIEISSFTHSIVSIGSIILLISFIIAIVYFGYSKLKERELIQQVTPATRGEWSERKVIEQLLKEGINPKAIFHD